MEPPLSDPAPDLDDPAYARFAWRRFRRVLAWMTVAAIGAAGVCVLLLAWSLDGFYLHASIATGLGVFASVWLAALLMGLTFFSAGTGHDARVMNRMPEEQD